MSAITPVERRPQMAPSNASNANTTGSQLFGVYDSPTLLPRTPLAPETLMGSSSQSAPSIDSSKEDDNSTENGSNNGDAAATAANLAGLDASSMLAAREKSLISHAMDTLTRKVSENDNDDEAGEGSNESSDEEMFDLEAVLLDDNIIPFKLATPSPMPSNLNVHFICETASRLLFLSVHWVRSIPAFSQLK